MQNLHEIRAAIPLSVDKPTFPDSNSSKTNPDRTAQNMFQKSLYFFPLKSKNKIGFFGIT
ncbi:MULTISPECIES: hypothetical protein [Leptospira]|uniref:Uncharacterized protein n=3 Tax=Leptospira santarosai TaxID=28183 RepID=A0AB73N9Y0_9LEPT|nr:MULTISPECIES: hypothetical protein [Leptospira]EMO59280.1 hypothetical protein LEP1GSC161_0860 [Leptospira santarosai str. CBC1416]ASV11868.1 hypothetical protein B2G51_09180 [Leptospira santarosai]EKO79716.1 hypothetical protein LEP1GSC068_3145 [Leptospira sp. Fiocruz LV3954]EMF89865.1 hypothetical protein LEP1GSC005_3828 [Leptospira santarosai str. ST188]EMI68753.1 hypothetical protein LEP1GSC076_2345 [Leptospira sp. Fiocruz LV4135]